MSYPGTVQSQRSSRRSHPSVYRGFFSTCLLAIALLSALAFAVSRDKPTPFKFEAYAASSQVTSLPKRLVTKPIEKVELGERVVGRNPLREQVEVTEPEPGSWSKICLEMQKNDGGSLSIELLRPHHWVESCNAKVGNVIALELYEMGAVGPATVTAVEECPPIHSGTGTVVTGKFKHRLLGARVVELRIEGQQEPVTVTDNHPYWSEDRQAFIGAGKLRVAEQVNTSDGVRRVLSLERRTHQGLVYNLETVEHVYRVGSRGTLVHNSCPTVFLHGSSRESVDDIIENGLDAAKAGDLGGGDIFWAVPEAGIDAARFFAEANPSGGAAAILRLDLPEKVAQSLIDDGLLIIRKIEDGSTWYEFSREAWEKINEFGVFTLLE